MKRILSGVVLIAFLAAGLAAADDPVPNIVIPKLKHDFGEVFERDRYEYSFVVRNTGTADLQIESVRPG